MEKGSQKVKKIKNLPQKIWLSLFFAAYTVLLYVSKIGCVILRATGINCLGCGMTRAWLSALRLDLAAAVDYHLMFWSVPFIYISFLLDGNLFQNKKLNTAFHIAVLLGFVANWVFHNVEFC